jgi:predicted Rossmann fold flavoprotein
MEHTKQVIVIGAGPAGLMAAGQAALQHARVLLLEKMPQPGRKLLISGKGRCNLTNACDLPTFLTHYGKAANFLKPALYSFDNTHLINFFASLGMATVTERGGRIFPASSQAREVVDALTSWVLSHGVVLKTKHRVLSLMVTDGKISGVEVVDSSSHPPQKKLYPAQAVVLATGGASYPGTGSTGDGYRIAQDLGHTIVPIRPALTPLVTSDDIVKQIQGLSLKNVRAEVWCKGKKINSAFGEMLFTHFGLSGPIILTLSKTVVDLLNDQEEVSVKLDLKPALDESTLDQRLLREFTTHPQMLLRTILKSLIPLRLIPICLVQTNLAPDKTGSQITAAERRRLRTWLKNFTFNITGYRPFSEAIITAGGIALSEVDRNTLESKLIKGLYFAGEVLDIDADTGGFNLQAAFATGYLAGRACLKSLNL